MSPPGNANAPSLKAVASQIYEALAETFPICTSSDEFYYFPQVSNSVRQWGKWDNFSTEAVAGILKILADAIARLHRLSEAETNPEIRIDISMLLRTARTVYEQLDRVAVHRPQPTF